MKKGLYCLFVSQIPDDVEDSLWNSFLCDSEDYGLSIHDAATGPDSIDKIIAYRNIIEIYDNEHKTNYLQQFDTLTGQYL